MTRLQIGFTGRYQGRGIWRQIFFDNFEPRTVPILSPRVNRIGTAAIAVMVVWWMLGSFSKRLDKLTDAIATLTGQVKKP